MYIFRTALLGDDRRKRIYGIQFTEAQLRLIDQITSMLHAYDNNDEVEREE